jgi:hypothetical protein
VCCCTPPARPVPGLSAAGPAELATPNLTPTLLPRGLASLQIRLDS